MLVRRAAVFAGIVGAFATMSVAPASSGLIVNPDATIVVSNLHPVEGETITVHNADNADSTCVGGTAVVFVEGLPPGELSQRVATPDVDGNWEVTVTFPLQADWPSNDVGGPFTLDANCFEGSNTEVDTRAEPEFAYVPVEVTLATPEPAPAPEPVEVEPAFTG